MTDLVKKEMFDLTATTFDQAIKYAEYISKSSFIPKDFRDKPADILLAIQMGSELGLKPLQALQNIAVINGRPCIWGDAMLAIILAHPECEDVIEESYQDQTEGLTKICRVKRKGKTEVKGKFSMADAKKASLTGKPGPWSQYPDRMLQVRARGFALRDSFADALKGIITREEAEDYPLDNAIEGSFTKVESFKNVLSQADDSVTITAVVVPSNAEVVSKDSDVELKTAENKVQAVNSDDIYDKIVLSFEKSKNIKQLKEAAKKVNNFTGTEKQKTDLRNKYSIRADELKTALIEEQSKHA